ncbi:unnamed protein product, partial [Pocillopora meandrina]
MLCETRYKVDVLSKPQLVKHYTILKINRCKQAKGYHYKVLEGKSLILIDDPGQLPSVAGELVYHSKPSNAIGEQGYQTYRMFHTVIKPTINQRVQDDCIKQEKIRNL